MKTQILVKRYTQGLINALTGDEEFSRLQKELSGFASLLSTNKELMEALSSPFIPSSRKVQIVNEILAKEKLNGKTSRFLLLLADNDRLGLLPEILELMPLLWNEARGISTFEVTSAYPLNAEQKRKLKRKLESLEKSPVILKYRIEPGLIGGLSIRKENVVYDISLEGSLSRMKEKIIKG